MATKINTNTILYQFTIALFALIIIPIFVPDIQISKDVHLYEIVNLVLLSFWIATALVLVLLTKLSPKLWMLSGMFLAIVAFSFGMHTTSYLGQSFTKQLPNTDPVSQFFYSRNEIASPTLTLVGYVGFISVLCFSKVSDALKPTKRTTIAGYVLGFVFSLFLIKTGFLLNGPIFLLLFLATVYLLKSKVNAFFSTFFKAQVISSVCITFIFFLIWVGISQF